MTHNGSGFKRVKEIIESSGRNKEKADPTSALFEGYDIWRVEWWAFSI